jgi:nitroreductase
LGSAVLHVNKKLTKTNRICCDEGNVKNITISQGVPSMDAFEAIRQRRSIRKYTGAAIPRSDLETIVDAGRCAASGNNQQPWEFIVITERVMLERLKVASLWMEQAGAIIAVVMDPSSRWWLEDGSAAIENILLACTALGYGACWLEGYTLPREAEFKSWLGIPPERRLLTLIPIGVPAEAPTRTKKALTDVLYWERYGTVTVTKP